MLNCHALFVGLYGIYTGKSMGSGTIIDEDGTILTCAHVVVDHQGLKATSKGKVCIVLKDYMNILNLCIGILSGS